MGCNIYSLKAARGISRATAPLRRDISSFGVTSTFAIGAPAEQRVSHEDGVSLETIVPVASISPNLVEVVHPLLSPLYALFGFFPLTVDIVRTELTRLRANRY